MSSGSRPIRPVVPYSRPTAFQSGPRHQSFTDAAVRDDQVAQIGAQLRAGGVFVLTGAGVSTDSGIPDYRGPDGVRAATSPMTYQQFRDDPGAAQRYWARSFFGWPTLAAKAPNAVHRTVAQWQAAGLLSAVVTQNVDQLHQAGGCTEVLELHGSLHRVRCLDCGAVCARQELAERFAAANPELVAAGVTGQVAPDGDQEIPDELVAQFQMVSCAVCGSARLKPDVVYFGENVPKERVQWARAALAESRSVLVLGSSLTVMSGFRFVRDAATWGKPVAIITAGVSRGDKYANLRVDAALWPTVSLL